MVITHPDQGLQSVIGILPLTIERLAGPRFRDAAAVFALPPPVLLAAAGGEC
jgi:hypothetical protein